MIFVIAFEKFKLFFHTCPPKYVIKSLTWRASSKTEEKSQSFWAKSLSKFLEFCKKNEVELHALKICRLNSKAAHAF